jgi:hypothetical protein
MGEENKEIIVKNTEAGVRIEITATEEMQKRWEEFCKRMGFGFINKKDVPERMFEEVSFNPLRDIYYFNSKKQTPELINTVVLSENDSLKEKKPEIWRLLFDLVTKHKLYAEVILSKNEEGKTKLEKIFLAGDKTANSVGSV